MISQGKRLRLLLAGLIGLATPIAASVTVSAQDDKLHIAVAMNWESQQRWKFDRAGMEAEASKHGAEISILYANNDATKQISQVEALLSQNPDVLIIDPADKQAAGQFVLAAHEQGVPVIAYDEPITGQKIDHFVGRDNYAAGVMQAEEALKFAASGKYALITGDPSFEIAQVIRQAWVDTLSKKPSVKVVFDQSIRANDPAGALAAAENAFSANKDDLQALMIPFDPIASVVAQAILSRDLQGKVFLSGLDGETASLNLIAKGVQTMTVFANYYDAGVSAVQAAVMLAQKKTPQVSKMVDFGAGEVPTYYIPLTAVTKENVCEVVKSAPEGWTSVSAVFDNPEDCK